MDNLDRDVLTQAGAWHDAGARVVLYTVASTWGSAPRPAGSLLALRADDGRAAGSVSGGCIEDDLIERLRAGPLPLAPSRLRYGVGAEEAARFGLPCGGSLLLIEEPLHDSGWVHEVLARTARHELVTRELNLADGSLTLRAALPDEGFRLEGERLITPFGPRWRMILIGAGQLSGLVARMALPLGFDVICCEPRASWRAGWDLPGTTLTGDMPDDVVLAAAPDAHTAILALTHDPRIDDLALMEALATPAFYVGALGSRTSNARRRERLMQMDLSAEQVARLHGPIGLDIGSQTPAEIAISALAQIVAVRSKTRPIHKPDAQVAASSAPDASTAAR